MVLAYFKRKLNERRLEKQRRLEEIDLAIWRFYHSSQSIDDIAVMTGKQFEEFLARLFRYMGYTEIRMTPSNDQGGDLVCISPHGMSTVIQAKRWNSPVGNKAVQEVIAAMHHYGCSEGIVVTNNTFTSAAVQLAKSADVVLRDNRWLQDRMNEFLPASIPEFNRERFEQIIEGFVEITRQAAAETSSRRKRFPRGHHTLSEGLRFAGQAKGRELSVQDVKTLAQLHISLSDSDAQLREGERRLQEALERKRLLDEEIAELDEALSMSESPSWADEHYRSIKDE